MDDFVDGSVIYLELTKDILSDIAWRTADRTYIYVKDMEDKHLRNAALFLMGMGYQKCIANEQTRVAWLTIFRMEWERRTIDRNKGNKRFRSYPINHAEIGDW